MSFGQIGFTCLGAYVAAWLTINPVMKKMSLPGLPDFILKTKMEYWQAAIFATIFAAIAALIFGRILMRLSGIAASIATFAMLAMINTIYSNWDRVTGATSSVVGIPIVRSIWPYFTAAAIVIFIAWLHAISRSGLALRAARDEPTAAAASGIDIPKQRLIAFVISGAIMGAGGALTAHSIGVVTPDNFLPQPHLRDPFHARCRRHGEPHGQRARRRHPLGADPGTSLPRSRRSRGRLDAGAPKGLQEIALGIIMIVILALRPAGLFGNRELTLNRNRSE